MQALWGEPEQVAVAYVMRTGKWMCMHNGVIMQGDSHVIHFTADCIVTLKKSNHQWLINW